MLPTRLVHPELRSGIGPYANTGIGRAGRNERYVETPNAGLSTKYSHIAAAVVSRLVMGALSDKFSPHLLGCATTILSSLSVFLVWGVASTSFPPLILFGVCFGTFASGWSSLFMRICGDFSIDGDRAS